MRRAVVTLAGLAVAAVAATAWPSAGSPEPGPPAVAEQVVVTTPPTPPSGTFARAIDHMLVMP